MKSTLILLLLAGHAGIVLAQYKCTAANGAITFQQTPCLGAKSGEKLEVKPNGHPAPASAAPAPGTTGPAANPPSTGQLAASVDKRMLAGYEKAHQRERYQQAIRAVQDDMARRADQRAADVATVQQRFADDPAALAGALQAVAAHYQAMSELDNLHLDTARTALADWERNSPQ